jgi:hypothetical protein
MMKAVEIKRVYYSDDKGNIVTETVKDMISIQASAITKHIHNLKNDVKEDSNTYFQNLLRMLLPPEIKKENFEKFVKHNLYNVLPEHTYIFKNSDGTTIVSILDKNENEIVSSKLIK